MRYNINTQLEAKNTKEIFKQEYKLPWHINKIRPKDKQYTQLSTKENPKIKKRG